jgi:hypothetical protein
VKVVSVIKLFRAGGFLSVDWLSLPLSSLCRGDHANALKDQGRESPFYSTQPNRQAGILFGILLR